MPETRTFDPTGDDPIQLAVRKALGETIRPVEPGSTATPPASGLGRAPVTQATLGAFTFVSVPRPSPNEDD